MFCSEISKGFNYGKDGVFNYNFFSSNYNAFYFVKLQSATGNLIKNYNIFLSWFYSSFIFQHETRLNLFNFFFNINSFRNSTFCNFGTIQKVKNVFHDFQLIWEISSFIILGADRGFVRSQNGNTTQQPAASHNHS